MQWQIPLLIMVGGLLVLLSLGMAVAWAFLGVCIIGAILWLGGEAGLDQLILSIKEGMCSFTFLPIPLFVLMGEVMFQSGVAISMIDTVNEWLGRLPGRLGLLAVAAGTLFSVMSGNTMSSTALLGSTLTPEMEKRGYSKAMSRGPILGSGGLAMMIPPSGLAILVAALGDVSIGKTLVAIIVPGLLMASLYAPYIIVRCRLQPSLAPSYEVVSSPVRERIVAAGRYVLPLGFIIFAVLGVIFMGIATPTEAAATGALACFILAAANRKMNWQIFKRSIVATLEIVVMIFMLILTSKAFTQILCFSGASAGLLRSFLAIPMPSTIRIVLIMVILLIVGMFMSPIPTIMVIIPIFVPIITTLGYDPVWFMVLLLLNIEMGTTSPPYGMSLFVMKKAAPPDTKMKDIYLAALPFLYCDVIVMALLIGFPAIALWLPSLMS